MQSCNTEDQCNNANGVFFLFKILFYTVKIFIKLTGNFITFPVNNVFK